jgi:hypothetical protein
LFRLTIKNLVKVGHFGIDQVGQLFVPSLFPFIHRARRKLLLARAPGVTVNFLRC